MLAVGGPREAAARPAGLRAFALRRCSMRAGCELLGPAQGGPKWQRRRHRGGWRRWGTLDPGCRGAQARYPRSRGQPSCPHHSQAKPYCHLCSPGAWRAGAASSPPVHPAASSQPGSGPPAPAAAGQPPRRGRPRRRRRPARQPRQAAAASRRPRRRCPPPPHAGPAAERTTHGTIAWLTQRPSERQRPAGLV